MKLFCCDFFFSLAVVGVCERVCTGWVDLRVIEEKIKIYSYLHVAKNHYPQDDS